MGIWVEVCQRAGIKIDGIVDSDYYGNTETYKGIPVVGSEKDMDHVLSLCQVTVGQTHSRTVWNNTFFIATNWDPSGLLPERDNEKRELFKKIVEEYKLPLQNIIDPSAVIGVGVSLGGGNYVGAGAIIESEVTIGKHTQIWYQSIVGHHITVGEDTVLQRRTGVWGADIGNHVYLGIGAIYGGNYKTSHVGDGAWIHPGLAVAGRKIEAGETVTIREQIRQRRTQTVGSFDSEAL